MEEPILDIAEYKIAVEDFAKRKEDFFFKNSSPQHAAVVLVALFKYTKNKIKIYDNDLSGDIVKHDPESLSVIQKFIENGNSLQVVVNSDDHKNSDLYKLIKTLSEKHKKVVVKLASEEFKKTVSASLNSLCHFAVGDSRSFRLELHKYSVTQINRAAICSFNTPGVASKLEKMFEQNFVNCKTLIN
jgi:hypothetical protein